MIMPQVRHLCSLTPIVQRMQIPTVSISLATSVCGLGVVPGSSQCGSQENVGDGPAIYRAYQQVVSYLREHGTIVIAAAANNHVRINQEGMVTSHGSLAGHDFYGTTIPPGGIPGVFAVAALNRVTMPGSANETRYGQFGVGRADQLAASSNYGEPIAISAPGGSSNYNVLPSDCLTANCVRTAPSVPGATDNPGVFGAWGVDASGQPCNSCYVYGTGTSVATPTVAAVAALLLASHPHLSVEDLSRQLEQAVTRFNDPNVTPALETDSSLPTYPNDLDYDGPAISANLMGSGVIDAERAVKH